MTSYSGACCKWRLQELGFEPRTFHIGTSHFESQKLQCYDSSSAWHMAGPNLDILVSQVPLTIRRKTFSGRTRTVPEPRKRVAMLHLGFRATGGCLHSRELLLQGRLVDRLRSFLELQWIMRRERFIRNEEDSISLSRKTSMSVDLLKKIIFVTRDGCVAKIHQRNFAIP